MTDKTFSLQTEIILIPPLFWRFIAWILLKGIMIAVFYLFIWLILKTPVRSYLWPLGIMILKQHFAIVKKNPRNCKIVLRNKYMSLSVYCYFHHFNFSVIFFLFVFSIIFLSWFSSPIALVYMEDILAFHYLFCNIQAKIHVAFN